MLGMSNWARPHNAVGATQLRAAAVGIVAWFTICGKELRQYAAISESNSVKMKPA